MSKILIARRVLAKMIEHAQERFPEECCGLLAGKRNHTSVIVRASNLLASPSAFFVPPEELFDFFRSLRSSGLDFTGIYHSHPEGPSGPSERDQEEFHYPEACYWIVSLAQAKPDVRCYRWVRIGFEEQDFGVTE